MMRWIPTLFAAEAIPSAMITFVALLMFLQLGIGWDYCTLLCALLSLPWVLKSFVRQKVRQVGHFSLVLRGIELSIFIIITTLAFCCTSSVHRRILVFACLFVLCMLCAWHELAARMYYERMLRPREQRIFNGPKMFFSQASVVMTYGVMIVMVGFLEVFYHNRRNAIALSWSSAIYLLAGFYLLLVLYNFFVLKPPHVGDAGRSQSIGGAVRAEMRVIDRIAHKPNWLVVILCLTLFLLPQSLMFYTRVLFLMATDAEGGLGCSLQWVGLAQGTVGVIAFSLGLGLGYRLNRSRRLLWPQALAMPLSPMVYFVMTQYPPSGLFPLCVATFAAQFCFGLGLNGCLVFIRYISGERYRSTINYLYIPLVSLVMLPALAVSGWLVERTGFATFFLIDSLLAIPAWAAFYAGSRVCQ
jgi:PAT family beta-lactamase induction signal transducer AmpG